MLRESAQSIIDHIKYIFNDNNKIFEWYKRKLIEAQKNIGQENCRDCIKYCCRNNLG